MVECELVYHMLTFSTYKVLIDTWWNVNYTINALRIPIVLF